MAGEVIRELVALLGFDVDEQALKQAEKAMDDLASMAKRAVVGFVGVGASLVAASIKAAKYGDEVLAASKQTGIAVEALQELRHGAGLANVSADTLGGGLLALSRVMAGIDPRSKKVGAVLTSLGVRTRDVGGKLRGTDQVFEDIAEQISKMPDGAKKSATAMRIFGDSGAQLIPFLNEGKKGIAALRQEAVELGLVMSTKDAESADRLSDSLDRLRAIGSSLVMSVGFSALQEFADATLEWYRANQLLLRQRIQEVVVIITRAVRTGMGVFRRMLEVVINITNAFGGWKVVVGIIAAAYGLRFLGAIGAAVKAINTMIVATNLLSISQLKAVAIPALIGAAFLALAFFIGLVIEDVYKFATSTNSADSALGTFLATFSKPISAKDNAFLTFLKLVATTLEGIVHFGDGAARVVSDLMTLFGQNSDQPEDQNAAKKRLLFGLGIGDLPKANVTSADEALARWRAHVAATKEPPLVFPRLPPAAIGSSTPSIVTDNRRAEIHVNGAGDPKAVAAEVNRHLSRELDWSTPFIIDPAEKL